MKTNYADKISLTSRTRQRCLFDTPVTIMLSVSSAFEHHFRLRHIIDYSSSCQIFRSNHCAHVLPVHPVSGCNGPSAPGVLRYATCLIRTWIKMTNKQMMSAELKEVSCDWLDFQPRLFDQHHLMTSVDRPTICIPLKPDRKSA